MQDFLRQLPSIVVIGTLVAIFIALQRRHRSSHVHYWLLGWGLMFVHFIVSLLQFSPLMARMESFLETGTLQLAGVAFLASVFGVVYRRDQVWLLAVYLAVPVTFYSALQAYGVAEPLPYSVCLAAFFYGSAIWGFLQRRSLLLSVITPGFVAVFGTWVIVSVTRGEIAIGSLGLLLVTFAMTGMLFLLSYPQATPGVIVTVFGFLAWAGVWACNIWLPRLVQTVGARSELWNVPKILVAFGMILVLLEQESLAAQAASERERAANVQLQRFADVTSRLLSGVDVTSFAGHIAKVVTEATTFMRVAIVLMDDEQRFFVAGDAGIAEADLAHVNQSLAAMTTTAADALFHQGRVIGKTAVLISSEQLENYSPARTKRHYEPNPHWSAGNEVYVPLRSRSGALVGFISLDDPKDPDHVNASETSKIEMLAADLAVAVDNIALQRQLVVSEKLAGLGQLVSGVAHELNNPLTAVLGYAELLNDQARDEQMRHGLNTIYREAQRIKTIVANLLRFAQQDMTPRRAIDLLPILQELLHQKSLEAKTCGVEIVDSAASSLPRVAVDESQIKQVFLNILNNAMEAVADAEEKRITVIARAENSRVVFTFMDTGPGFSDLNRIFDPFYTTKSPGKGTGLGLSICYGVLKQHGGNITARNVHPTGACVTIELPTAKEQAASA